MFSLCVHNPNAGHYNNLFDISLCIIKVKNWKTVTGNYPNCDKPRYEFRPGYKINFIKFSALHLQVKRTTSSRIGKHVTCTCAPTKVKTKVKLWVDIQNYNSTWSAYPNYCLSKTTWAVIFQLNWTRTRWTEISQQSIMWVIESLLISIFNYDLTRWACDMPWLLNIRLKRCSVDGVVVEDWICAMHNYPRAGWMHFRRRQIVRSAQIAYFVSLVNG